MLQRTTSVLIIDDDEKLLRLLKQYLERSDFSVVTESNPLTGIKLHNEHHFDIVILDLMMPQMNGFDVCREIRSAGATPVIMMSARKDSETHGMALAAGSTLFLAKPFSPLLLVEHIRSVLGRLKPNSDERGWVPGSATGNS